MLTRFPPLYDYSAKEGDYYHIKMGLKESVIKEALIRGLEGLDDYLLDGEPLARCIEFQKFYKIYPLSYKIPSKDYIDKSICWENDAYTADLWLIDREPQRLQIFLPISIEFYKFTGKIFLWRTFDDKSFAHFFKPWKDEHEKRFKVLMGIIREYWDSVKKK
ncbi:MAG: hypothetical protein IJG38_15355 [Thermoguttaceae bacterium]|nr:hypothetical protein [Thermoguttaceae bacterium]